LKKKYIILIYFLCIIFFQSYTFAISSDSGVVVNSETDFKTAFYNTDVSEIVISGTINLTENYTTNHNLKITTASSGSKLKFTSSYNFTVNSYTVLTIDTIIVEGSNSKSCISVENEGVLMLTDYATIYGNNSNWGIETKDGAKLLVESCQISNFKRGIVLKGNSYCNLADNTAIAYWGNTNKPVNINNNETGIYCGESYNGTLIVNHTSNTNDKIIFENNTEQAIFAEPHSGKITIYHAKMINNNEAIHTCGNLIIYDVNAVNNNRGLVNQGATVNFDGGGFYSDNSSLKSYGIYNNFGIINIRGGFVKNFEVGIWNTGTVNMYECDIDKNTNGIENYGLMNLFGGSIHNGTNGIINENTFNMNGSTLSNFVYGVKNIGSFIFSGGIITNNSQYGFFNESCNTVIGQLYITGGTITENSVYDIYHEKSDSDTAGAVYGGFRIELNDEISSKIYLAKNDNYIYTGDYEPKLNSIALSEMHLDKKIIRTESQIKALAMSKKINVLNKGDYSYKVSSEYVILAIPNVAVVKYEDLLSGVISAKYWKDDFSGSGADFENGKIFEEYGDYKVTVTDKVGLNKTITFSLNDNSI